MKHYLAGLAVLALVLVSIGLTVFAFLMFAVAAVGVLVMRETWAALFAASVGSLSLMLARSLVAWLDV